MKNNSRLPQLKVKTFPGESGEDIRDFEQATYLPFLDVFICIEGQRVNSYDEFLKVANQDNLQDRAFLDVMILSAGLVDGG